MVRKIIYLDLDDTLCDYSGAFARAIKLEPEIAYPQSQYRFYANLQPLEGGIETAMALLRSDKYDPYILSAPSVQNPFSYTEKREWVEKHLGFAYCERLILSPNKGLLKGDILIDDQPQGRGQENFEGQFILFGSENFPNWKTVRQYLEL